MGRYIAKEVGKDISELPYVLSSEELRKEFGQATFFTATDGNHGRGVHGLPTSWARSCCTCTCPRVPPSHVSITSPRAPQLPSKRSTTTSACAWLPPRPTPASAASSFRIPPGRDMKKSRPGSCRDTEPWLSRLLSSCARSHRPSDTCVCSGWCGFACRSRGGLLHQPVSR